MASGEAADFTRGLPGAPSHVEELYELAVTAVMRPVELLYHKCSEAALLGHLKEVFSITDSQHSQTIKAASGPKQTSTKAKKRKLGVSVVACYGLAAKDDKTSNPYVTVLYEDQEFNTATVEQSLNPNFNDIFEFDEIPKMPLMVSVWSAPGPKAKGKDKEPKFLGQVVVPPDEFAAPGRGENHPYTLEKRSARSTVSGAVVLNIAFIPELPPDPIEPPAPLDRDVDHRTCHILFSRLLLDADARKLGYIRNSRFAANNVDAPDTKEMETLYAPSAESLHLMELYARVYEVDSMPAKLMYLGQELERCKDNVDADYTKLALAMAGVYREHLTNSARLAAMPPDARAAIDAAIATVNADCFLAIQQYKFRFPTVNRSVTGQLDLVLFLLHLSQKMRAATVGSRTSPAALITDAATACKKQVYKLVDAQAEASRGDSLFAHISLAADLVEDEQNQDKDFYDAYFSMVDVDLRLLNALTLWTWHAASARDLLREHQGQPVKDWDDLFKLYKQLKTMHARHLEDLVSEHPDVEKIYGPLHDWFKPWLVAWLVSYDDRVVTYSKRAMEMDRLEPVTVAQLHSTSIVDTLTLLSQEIDDIDDIGWPVVAHLVEFYENFARTVGRVIHAYSEWLVHNFSNWQYTASADDSRITSQLCVALNNIAQMKEGIDDTRALVRQRMETRGCEDLDLLPVDRAFADIFQPMAAALKFLIDLASKTLAPTLEHFLIFLIGAKRSKADKSQKTVLTARKGDGRTTIVKGVEDARLKTTQKRIRQLLAKTKLATWTKGRSANITVAADERAAYDQVRDAMDPLLAYLDLNFEVFAEYLYEDVFSHLINTLWALCLSILERILDPAVQREKAGKALSMQQGALLRFVLGVLAKYFIADGDGLSDTLVKSEQYYNLEDKIGAYGAATTHLMGQYFETQTDKILSESALEKPNISYDVQYMEGTDRLHTEDRIKVFVRSAARLPALDADGGVSARVTIQILHPLFKEPLVETTSIVSGSTDPVFNEKKEFSISSTKGILHLAVHHVAKKDTQFLGETAFNLASLAENPEPIELHESLLPQPAPRAAWLLNVLATREDDPVATRFVQERRSKVLGRAADGAKVHATSGHLFRATHKSVPPSCAVCKKVILGIGKPVYECELCGTTTHKACHTNAAKCARGSASSEA